jgi:hypothetical protein
MCCSIIGESIFNPKDNNINILKYQKLCNEFNVGKNIDFRFKGGYGGVLGTMYNYWANQDYRPSIGDYDPKRYQFVENSGDGVYKIDYIKQDAATDGWKQLILETSKGFPGRELLELMTV